MNKKRALFYTIILSCVFISFRKTPVANIKTFSPVTVKINIAKDGKTVKNKTSEQQLLTKITKNPAKMIKII